MKSESDSTRVISPALGGTESVLLVEDNAAMRKVVHRQLTELGYKVTEADGAAAASGDLARESFDLLFSDAGDARSAQRHRPGGHGDLALPGP